MRLNTFFSISGTIVSVLLSLTLQAQQAQVTASSGGLLEGETRQVAYTIGEPIINTLEGAQMIVTQGFHQPKLWVTAIDKMEGIAFQIKAYPNPATSFVKLNVNEKLPNGSIYQLYDIHGGLITQSQIESQSTEIPFQNLAPASYFLKVMHNSNTLKTFKIVKSDQ